MMTREQFIRNAEIEITCLQEAYDIYPCEQLRTNFVNLQIAVSSVRRMNDFVFRSFWHVMRSDFEYLETYYNEDYYISDGDVPF